MGLGANHFSDPFTAFFCSWLFIVLALIIWLFDIELELPLIFFLLLQFVVAGANIRCDAFAAFLWISSATVLILTHLPASSYSISHHLLFFEASSNIVSIKVQIACLAISEQLLWEEAASCHWCDCQDYHKVGPVLEPFTHRCSLNYLGVRKCAWAGICRLCRRSWCCTCLLSWSLLLADLCQTHWHFLEEFVGLWERLGLEDWSLWFNLLHSNLNTLFSNGLELGKCRGILLRYTCRTISLRYRMGIT